LTPEALNYRSLWKSNKDWQYHFAIIWCSFSYKAIKIEFIGEKREPEVVIRRNSNVRASKVQMPI
jgi:hypothetical protein